MTAIELAEYIATALNALGYKAHTEKLASPYQAKVLIPAEGSRVMVYCGKSGPTPKEPRFESGPINDMFRGTFIGVWRQCAGFESSATEVAAEVEEDTRHPRLLELVERWREYGDDCGVDWEPLKKAIERDCKLAGVWPIEEPVDAEAWARLLAKMRQGPMPN